jgi:hypothetical protein
MHLLSIEAIALMGREPGGEIRNVDPPFGASKHLGGDGNAQGR